MVHCKLMKQLKLFTYGWFLTLHALQSKVFLSASYLFVLFAFWYLPPPLVVQTLPGQPVTMPRQNNQATGGDRTGDAGRCNAQNHGCFGTLCQWWRDQGINTGQEHWNCWVCYFGHSIVYLYSSSSSSLAPSFVLGNLVFLLSLS